MTKKTDERDEKPKKHERRRKDEKPPSKAQTAGTLAKKLGDYLEVAFQSVHLTRRQHFSDNPGKRPNRKDVDALITSYANQNALIAGAANLVPGPWGALTVIPEITLIVRNQIQMVYDLSVAQEKEAQLTSHTLLAIFATVTGGGAISLAAVKGGRLLVKRASLRVMQRVIAWLGGRIAQKVLKAFVARYVPILGAGAMAIWARQSTIAMGKKAADLLSKELVVEDAPA